MSYNKNTEFYIKTKSVIDFITSFSFNGMFLSNCFYNIVFLPEELHKWINKIMIVKKIETDSEQIILEIQSSYMYNVDRFNKSHLVFLNNVFENMFGEVFVESEELKQLQTNNIVEENLQKYITCIEYDKTQYSNSQCLENTIKLFNSLKKQIEQNKGTRVL